MTAMDTGGFIAKIIDSLMAKAHNHSWELVTPLNFWGLALTSAIVGAGHRACQTRATTGGCPYKKGPFL